MISWFAVYCADLSWWLLQTMVLKLDGNSQHVAHVYSKVCRYGEKSVWYCYRSNQMPSSDQITDIVPYVRTYSYFLI